MCCARCISLKSRLSLPRDIEKNAIEDVIKSFRQGPIFFLDFDDVVEYKVKKKFLRIDCQRVQQVLENAEIF